MAEKNDKKFSEIILKLLNMPKEQQDALIAKLTDAHAKHEKVIADNKELFEKTKHLTIGVFIRGLKDAIQYQKGYYKNAKGEYYFIRGVEIDGRCDLFRSGMNGEDHGIFVHFTEISESRMFASDMEICQVYFMMTTSDEKARLVPCTEQEFDEAFERLAAKRKYEPEVCEDPQKYLDAYQAYCDTDDEAVEAMKEVLGDEDLRYDELQFFADLLRIGSGKLNAQQ